MNVRFSIAPATHLEAQVLFAGGDARITYERWLVKEPAWISPAAMCAWRIRSRCRYSPIVSNSLKLRQKRSNFIEQTFLFGQKKQADGASNRNAKTICIASSSPFVDHDKAGLPLVGQRQYFGFATIKASEIQRPTGESQRCRLNPGCIC